MSYIESTKLNLKLINKISYKYTFSICTLVTNKIEYHEMLQSFLNKGFTSEECEFLYIDNTKGCGYEAYQGLNLFLQQAKGQYIIICHQDIVLIDDDKKQLLKCIEEINYLDPDWGILANAGGINFKWIVSYLTPKNGVRHPQKNLPLRTKTIDENFMLVKNDANLSLSHDLKGFHFYGTDICLIAKILGYNSYIIRFNLLHKSDGTIDSSFYTQRKALIKKYRNVFKNRFLSTTTTRFYISSNVILHHLINTQLISFFVIQYYKHVWHRKRYVPKRV
ncbi:MAG: hypothetical protein EOP43_02505 [Sphingobacteriaceae bacterium]|nr:MAG: hypothetical protein EOP43_02505 [Sphingobacteriaceae bacterium]